MRNPDRVLSRGEIMNHVWDFDFDSLSNVVDVHMKNIRKKLDLNSVIIIMKMPATFIQLGVFYNNHL